MEYDGENDLETELAVAKLVNEHVDVVQKTVCIISDPSKLGWVESRPFQKHSAETCVALIEKLKLEVFEDDGYFFAKKELFDDREKLTQVPISHADNLPEAVYECAALIVQANNE